MNQVIKITFLLIIPMILFFPNGMVFAQTELPDPGLTPDNAFYFLDTIAEEIGNFFVFGDLEKAERYALQAAERIAEAKAMAEKEKPELVEKTLGRYRSQLNKSMARAEKAMNEGKDFDRVMESIARAGRMTSVHLEVLGEVYERVPEQAKTAIENAMQTSIKRHEKAVGALKAIDRLGDVPEEVSMPAQISRETREKIQRGAETELMVDQALQNTESLRDICMRGGAPQEMCEKIPANGFRSFEQIEDFCVEAGGSSEVCASLESMCREIGITRPDDCMRALMVSSVQAYQSTDLEVTHTPVSSGETTETQGQNGGNSPYVGGAPAEISLENLECATKGVIYYYFEGCSPCQRIENEGTLEKLERIGIRVNRVDTLSETPQYQLQGVPSFVVDGEVHTGYKSLEALLELLRCQ